MPGRLLMCMAQPMVVRRSAQVLGISAVCGLRRRLMKSRSPAPQLGYPHWDDWRLEGCGLWALPQCGFHENAFACMGITWKTWPAWLLWMEGRYQQSIGSIQWPRPVLCRRAALL